MVEESQIFLSVAFDDNHHHVLGCEFDGVGRFVNRGVNGFELSLVVKVVRIAVYIFSQGAQQCKRCVEHQCCINRTVHILVGVANRDGAHSSG